MRLSLHRTRMRRVSAWFAQLRPAVYRTCSTLLTEGRVRVLGDSVFYLGVDPASPGGDQGALVEFMRDGSGELVFSRVVAGGGGPIDDFLLPP